jgi:hypothetical protein
MAFREVKIYDGEFPTHEQMLSGDPTRPPFPREVWLPQVRPGEFAVRYKDFKTGLPRSVDGKHVRASEICRIFDNLEDARTNSAQITRVHWNVVCLVYDHRGAQVERISNDKQLSKHAVYIYTGIPFSAGVYALAGMGVLWLIYRLGHAALFSHEEPIHSLGWLAWLGFSIAGLAVGVFAYVARPILAGRRMAGKLRASISPEDRVRFEDLNRLYGTADPKERERFLALRKELEEKVKQGMKK